VFLVGNRLLKQVGILCWTGEWYDSLRPGDIFLVYRYMLMFPAKMCYKGKDVEVAGDIVALYI